MEIEDWIMSSESASGTTIYTMYTRRLMADDATDNNNKMLYCV